MPETPEPSEPRPSVTNTEDGESSATASHADGKRPISSTDGEAGPSKRPCVAAAAEAPAAVPAATPPIDELVAAAPKLVSAIRSAVKCVKVAEKVASLLEEGKVKISNAGAVYDVLSAAVEDPMRWRKPSMRSAFRRLFSAADARLSLFQLHQQQSIKVWKLRVVTEIDLLSNHPEQFANAVLEVTMKLRRLPCDNPANEPRSSAQPGYKHLLTGARQDYLPERTRPSWCGAILECLEVLVVRFEGPQLWARPEVNTLVKLAAERRQSVSVVTRVQQEVCASSRQLMAILGLHSRDESRLPISRRCLTTGRSSARPTLRRARWSMRSISRTSRCCDRL